MESNNRDSVELKGLNTDHWGVIFDQYDHNNDGLINYQEFHDIIKSAEFRHNLPRHVVDEIFRRADKDGNAQLNRAEFVRIATHPETSHLFDNLRQRGRQYVKFLVPRPPTSRRATPMAITTVDGQYEEEYSCCPPRVAMIAISAVIIVLFVVDVVIADNMHAQGPVATDLLYNPHRRKEAWRYLTYMFVHVGKMHLIVNIFVQLMLGVPLEMVHGWRVLVVYIAGVVAGSLGTSICDPTVKLAGASGGVYSLMTAHLATIAMNWHDMTYPLLQLLIFVVLIGSDVGTAIYNRYVLMQFEPIGYAAHFCGAVAGILVGITVLRNISINRGEKWVQIIAAALYVLLMGAAIIFNVAATGYFPVQHV